MTWTCICHAKRWPTKQVYKLYDAEFLEFMGDYSVDAFRKDEVNFAILLLLVLILAFMTTKTAYFRATLHEPLTTSKAGMNRPRHDSRYSSFSISKSQKNIFERVDLPAGVKALQSTI